MLDQLTPLEQKALCWLQQQRSPVYSFKKYDPQISTISVLIKKRLVRVNKIITHPSIPAAKVSCFTITRKGKRYCSKIVGSNNE